MASVAFALRGDGVQEGRLDHSRLHAGPRQVLDALVEEGSRKGAGFVGDSDDHTVQMRHWRVARGAYGVYGVGAVLADGEDVGGRSFGGRGAAGLPQALPERRGLREPRFQRGPREPRPDLAGYPAGERALVVNEDAYRGFRRYLSPTSRFSSRRKNTSISFTV